VKKLLLILSFICIIKVNGQITFEKKVAGCQLSNIQQTKDGGYITCGTITNMACLIKMNSTGDTLWSKSYKAIGATTNGIYVSQTQNGNYILACSIDSIGAGGYDIYIVKTDSLGNLLWAKTYGGAGNDYVNLVQQTTDNGFVIAATTNSYGTTNSSPFVIYVIKIDSLGTIQWTNTYGGTTGQNIVSLQQTSDGGYIIGGANSSVFLLKTNALGNPIWSKKYLVTNALYSNLSGGYCQQTSDGGYIVCASSTNYTDSADTYYFKTDLNGNISWAYDIDKFYGVCNVSNSVYNIKQTLDGGYVFSNMVLAIFGGTGAGYAIVDNNIYKADSAGHISESSYYGTAGGTNSISSCNDSTCIVLQSLTSTINAIVKTDKNVNTTCNNYVSKTIHKINITSTDTSFVLSSGGGVANAPTQVGNSVVQDSIICSSVLAISTYNTQNSTIKIYPNPANNKITIDANDAVDVKLFDVLGKQITSTKTNNVDVSNLTNGIYFIQVQTKQNTYSQKIIVQH